MSSSSPTNTGREYIGTELELFQHAVDWKKYYAGNLTQFVAGHVLEVGAGIGGTTPFLWNACCVRWLCLEPDQRLVDSLRTNLMASLPDAPVEIQSCYVTDLPEDATFDSILYIDVLEHVRDDTAEVFEAFRRLRQGGHLVVLCPAHEWLFSEFDKSIGHYRRYSKKMFHSLTPDGAIVTSCRYLDSVGMLASLGNRLFLRQSLPNDRQLRFWNKYLVPISRILDPLLCYTIGKSIFIVWEKPRAQSC